MGSTKQTILDTWRGAKETVRNYSSVAKGKSNRQKMFDSAVNREVAKKYGGGQPVSGSNTLLYNKVRKDMLKKFREKNPSLWKDIK